MGAVFHSFLYMRVIQIFVSGKTTLLAVKSTGVWEITEYFTFTGHWPPPANTFTVSHELGMKDGSFHMMTLRATQSLRAKRSHLTMFATWPTFTQNEQTILRNRVISLLAGPTTYMYSFWEWPFRKYYTMYVKIHRHHLRCRTGRETNPAQQSRNLPHSYNGPRNVRTSTVRIDNFAAIRWLLDGIAERR